MNRTRRAQLDKIRIVLEDQKAEREAVSEDESAALDNMPDSIRDSAQGEAMEAAIDLMAEAADDMAHTLDTIREAAG